MTNLMDRDERRKPADLLDGRVVYRLDADLEVHAEPAPLNPFVRLALIAAAAIALWAGIVVFFVEFV
jgi:hypothetical protein